MDLPKNKIGATNKSRTLKICSFKGDVVEPQCCDALDTAGKYLLGVLAKNNTVMQALKHIKDHPTCGEMYRKLSDEYQQRRAIKPGRLRTYDSLRLE